MTNDVGDEGLRNGRDSDRAEQDQRIGIFGHQWPRGKLNGSSVHRA